EPPGESGRPWSTGVGAVGPGVRLLAVSLRADLAALKPLAHPLAEQVVSPGPLCDAQALLAHLAADGRSPQPQGRAELLDRVHGVVVEDGRGRRVRRRLSTDGLRGGSLAWHGSRPLPGDGRRQSGVVRLDLLAGPEQAPALADGRLREAAVPQPVA